MVEERISNLQAEVGFHIFSLILKLELCWLQVIALNNSFDAPLNAKVESHSLENQQFNISNLRVLMSSWRRRRGRR